MLKSCRAETGKAYRISSVLLACSRLSVVGDERKKVRLDFHRFLESSLRSFPRSSKEERGKATRTSSSEWPGLLKCCVTGKGCDGVYIVSF